MKTVEYSRDAARDLRRYGNVAGRVREAIREYAAGGGKRFRVGGFRVLFEETDTSITVTKVAPRGDVYDQG